MHKLELLILRHTFTLYSYMVFIQSFSIFKFQFAIKKNISIFHVKKKMCQCTSLQRAHHHFRILYANLLSQRAQCWLHIYQVKCTTSYYSMWKTNVSALKRQKKTTSKTRKLLKKHIFKCEKITLFLTFVFAKITRNAKKPGN